ncbi:MULTISPECIES: hypothetical protein [Streptococcus]|uniref:hypothetical protein n=1 Tax=Streptococcus TaxID=1301 RepID=UPI001E5F0D59|nr:MULTISPECIES: hypothetical protein [unclassified Streptococcus]
MTDNIINLQQQEEQGQPMTLTEFKKWLDETIELAEMVQDYRDKLPQADRERFEGLSFAVWNCLESIPYMLDKGELLYQPKETESQEADNDIEARYINARVKQLKEKSHDALADLIANYELELLDYAERLLADEPIPMDDVTAHGTLSLLDKGTLELLKELDTNKEYKGLHDYT